MKLIRAMALLALRPSLAPSWSPSPAELALSLVIGVSILFVKSKPHSFTKISTCLGSPSSLTPFPRQLESPVEVRGFMIVRLTDQRSSSSRTSWTSHHTSTTSHQRWPLHKKSVPHE